MAKKEDFKIVKTTKLSGAFVKAGEIKSFDPSVKATKDLIERGIIKKAGEITEVVVDTNSEKILELEKKVKELQAEKEELQAEKEELQVKIEELEAKDL